MARIATLAANKHLLELVSRTRERIQDLQTQVATGKRAQAYSGISADARQLIDMESRRKMLDQYDHDNALMETRLNATQATIDGIGESMRQFRQALIAVSTDNPPTAQQTKDLQEQAFRTLKNVQDYLNTELDGRYLFAGSAVRTAPVVFPFDSLQTLQQQYDGETVLYPHTASGNAGIQGALSKADTGDLTLSDTDADGIGDTITATNSGAFAQLRPGATITLSGGNSGNDGTYTVVAADGDRSIRIRGNATDENGNTIGPPAITVEGAVNVGTDSGTGLTITVGNWFRGDSMEQTYRLDADRSFSSDLSAMHPAFEKAIRALGIIAQGAPGTPGALENHPERIDQAMYLVDLALNRAPTVPAPFDMETTGSIDDAAMDVGFHQTMLADAKTLHSQLSSLMDDRIASIENTDMTEAISLLVDGTQALEASYQVLARVRELSLVNYL
jgi:flagellar hook-associated protein 3 FlgL